MISKGYIKNRGVSHTIELMAMKVEESLPYAKEWLPSLNCSPGYLYDLLKANTTYKEDPPGVELLQGMESFFEDNYWGVPGWGDCDCMSITSASCLIVSGFPVRFVVSGKRGFSHVYVEYKDKGKWRAFDLTNNGLGEIPNLHTHFKYYTMKTLLHGLGAGATASTEGGDYEKVIAQWEKWSAIFNSWLKDLQIVKSFNQWLATSFPWQIERDKAIIEQIKKEVYSQNWLAPQTNGKGMVNLADWNLEETQRGFTSAKEGLKIAYEKAKNGDWAGGRFVPAWEMVNVAIAEHAQKKAKELESQMNGGIGPGQISPNIDLIKRTAQPDEKGKTNGILPKIGFAWLALKLFS